MDILCGHHAKDPDVCRWVIMNTDPNSDNLTERRWRLACEKYLESIIDGPDWFRRGVE